MPLQSQMFRDDRALQACLVDNAAHVVPGSRGPHVAKIQSALMLLVEFADIPVSELRDQLYGTMTAAVVLNYKRKNRIINTSYQTTPDNIVGKMTIARLDKDILALEQRPTDGLVVCCGANAPIVSFVEPAQSFVALGGQSVGAPQKPSVRQPLMTFRKASVRVVLQQTDDAAEAGYRVSLLLGHYQKARELMTPFGLDFAGAAGGGIFPLIGPSVPVREQVITGSSVTTFSVRSAAEKVFPSQPDVLRIIYCRFTEQETAFGVTDGGMLGAVTFPKFCLINVRKANPDQGTMLHEMIHACRPGIRGHDADGMSVFSENIGFRSKLPPEHAEGIAHAFFSTIFL